MMVYKKDEKHINYTRTHTCTSLQAYIGCFASLQLQKVAPQ